MSDQLGSEPGTQVSSPYPPVKPEKPKWYKRAWVITLITLVVLAIIGVVIVAVSGGGEKKEEPVTTSAGWETVIEVSGNGIKKTENFRIDKGDYKLVYSIQSTSQMPVFSVYVIPEGHSLESKEGFFYEVFETKPTTGEVTLVKEPGSYYLDVEAANCDWHVTVQKAK